MCAGFTLLFLWVFARPITQHTYLSATDLFDYYLPSFLSPPLLWSSFEYAGTPAFADPEGSPYYPVRRFFADVAGSWTGFIVCGYVLAACALYAYVYRATASKRAATLAALTFALSEALVERLPHPTIVHAIAWVPLVLLAIDQVTDARRRWLWAAVGGLATGNCLLAGHPQVPLYAAYLCGAYAVCVAAEQRFAWRTLAGIAVIPIAGGLISAVSLWPLASVSGEAERQIVSLEDFVSYANTVPQMLSMSVPRIAHPGLESPTYVGITALMLAPLGAAQFTRTWRAIFWTIVAIITLALGVGGATPLAELVHELPFYDRFRIVSRHLVFAALALSVLAGYAVAALHQSTVRWRALLLSALPAAALLVATSVALARVPERFPLDPQVQAALPGDGSGAATQFVIAAASVTALIASWRVRRSALLFTLVLTVSAVDLLWALPWRVTPTGVAFETLPRDAMEPSVHVQRLRHQLEPLHQRLLTPGGARGNEVVAGPRARLWEIPIAGGYSSVQLRHIAALLPRAGNQRLNTGALHPDNMVLDLLAVRFVLVAAGAEDEPLLRADPTRWQEADRLSTSLVTDRRRDEQVDGETEYVVFENRRARPRAWIVGDLQAVSDGALENAIHRGRLPDGRPFDVATTALVDQPGIDTRGYGAGDRSASVDSIADSVIRVRTSASASGFLVLSEAHYEGWFARVDDGPTQPVIRTNLAFQGLEVPAGEHIVTFQFLPPSRRQGLILSVAGLAMVCLCSAFTLRRP